MKFTNPTYFNKNVVDTIMRDQELPEANSGECREHSIATEEDMVPTVFEHTLTQ